MLALIHSITLSSQDSIIDGFWGLKFGMTKNEVKRIVEAKPKEKQTQVNEILGDFSIKYMSFGNILFEDIALLLKNNKLYVGSFERTHQKKKEGQDLFNDLYDLLAEKYGRPERRPGAFTWGDPQKRFITLEFKDHSSLNNVILRYVDVTLINEKGNYNKDDF